MKKANFVLAAIVVLAIPFGALAKNLYIDQTNGSDGYDGLTWGTAKQSFAGAFAAAASGDTIRVASGRYYEHLAIPYDNMSLLGGYPPGGGVRDSKTNLAVIDGDSADRCLNTNNTNGLTFDGFVLQYCKSPDWDPSGGANYINRGGDVVITNCVFKNTYDSGAAGRASAIIMYSGVTVR